MKSVYGGDLSLSGNYLVIYGISTIMCVAVLTALLLSIRLLLYLILALYL